MITLSKVSKWYPNFQVLKHCSTEVGDRATEQHDEFAGFHSIPRHASGLE
jgi:hypothetical protein